MMTIEYYEACALLRLNTGRREPTLDDFHKKAWDLYANGKRVANGEPRPFVFRVEPAPADRFIFTIRSDRPFHGATQFSLSIERDAQVLLDYSFFPLVRSHVEGSDDEYREVALSAPDLIEKKATDNLARSGVTFNGTAETDLLGYWFRGATRNLRRFSVPMYHASISATIASEVDFASAFLDGVGRRRGYGAGLIRVRAGSATAPLAA